jgi:hypothetical protein
MVSPIVRFDINSTESKLCLSVVWVPLSPNWRYSHAVKTPCHRIQLFLGIEYQLKHTHWSLKLKFLHIQCPALSSLAFHNLSLRVKYKKNYVRRKGTKRSIH